MDPLTHAVVGIAVGSVAGGDFSVSNGILVASIVGAIAPDFDIIMQFWGDYVYLKHHRGFSHSLPGLGVISLGISLFLSFIYPELSFFTLFFWTILGALSHSILDIFNSYGAQFLWPFSKKMFTANLLMIYDPILTLCCFTQIIWGHKVENMYFYTLGIFIFYLGCRYLIRAWATRLLYRRLKDRYKIHYVVLLPHMLSLFMWDFIVKTEEKTIVGHLDMLKKELKILKKLKSIKNDLKDIFLKTKMGEVFSQFTPFMHVLCREEDDQLIGQLIDLRYYVKNRFLHNATVILSNDYKVQDALFHPYSFSKKIRII